MTDSHPKTIATLQQSHTADYFLQSISPEGDKARELTRISMRTEKYKALQAARWAIHCIDTDRILRRPA